MAPQPKNRKTSRAALLVFAVATALLLVGGIWADLTYHWTGYSGSISPLTSEQIIERQKTIWDWLDLLLIPLVLAAGALWFSRAERRNEQAMAEARAERERQIAAENAQEAALQAYLEQMSTLLLERKLRTSTEADNVRDVARVWTLTVLRRVQGERKGVVLRFLYESGLIEQANAVISLGGTDLRGADLRAADLSAANLRGADLSDAVLSGADLRDAVLRGAVLRNAALNGADLRDADLRDADLRDAVLHDAVLSDADLRDAVLRDADLRDADLRDAVLSDAVLSDADLRGADLFGANLLGANLRDCKYNQGREGTLWPDAFDPVAAGAFWVKEAGEGKSSA
jgi:hypothetical protein